MAGLFAITAASNIVLLDSHGRGKTSFTVSNLSGHPVQSHVFLSTQNLAALNWLTLVGRSEMDLPVAGSVQFVVNVAVPAGAPAGSYAFALHAVDVTRPDNTLTQGRTVSFTVPPTEARKPRLILWLLGLIVLLVSAYIIFILVTNQ